MSDQRLNIDAATGEEIEKGFKVAALSPTNIREGIIVTALFVFGIITAGPIGFRNAERQLAIVENLPRDVQTNRANCDHSSLCPRELSRQFNRLVRIGSRRDDD